MAFNTKLTVPGSLLSVLLAASVAAADADEVDRRCEDASYADSAEMCDILAKIADEFGKPPEVAREYRLRAARHRLWQCTSPASQPCLSALERLWVLSDDAAEVTMAAGLFQAGCADTHDAIACTHAAEASWYGRGVPVDAVASLAWKSQCPSCTFAPDVLTVGEPKPSWALASEPVHAARIRALVSAGATTEAEQVLRRARDGKNLYGAIATTVADELAIALWRAEVEPILGRGDQLQALAAAERLEKRVESPRLQADARRLRAELAARQVEQMLRREAGAYGVLRRVLGGDGRRVAEPL